MKLAIFGGTGLTGKELVKEAGKRGYAIRMLSRRDIDAGSLPEGTEVVRGDYLDPAARQETLRGADALLSTVGPPPTRKTDLTPEDYGRAMEQLIGELKQAGITRFINIASTGTRYGNEPYPLERKFFRMLFNFLAPAVIGGKELELKHLSQSDLDWTTVRPPLIKLGRGGTLVADDKTDKGRNVDATLLAQFMLDQLESDEWVRRAPFVGS